MPDNSPYIKRIYDFMNKAYGINGSVKPDKFHLSYDDFSSKLSSDSVYADKIFKGMSNAYGAKGIARPNAFTATIQDFRGKIGLNKATQNKTVKTAPSDPNSALLASAIDIPTEPQPIKGPGLMQDISAFNPILEKEQKKQDQDLQRGYQMLTAAPQVDPMTGQQAPQSEVQLSIQDKMRDIDEIEKNLQSSQKKADEFYKTTGGGLYYSFVKPVYESLLAVGKNVGAGTFRLAGDVGESFGMDHSKKVLDKTADKLVDYFDFNRLAREGNTSSFLNLTPTAQQGKLSKTNILPKAVGAISQMASLMGGAKILGGTNTSLFTSSFVTTYEDYRQRAKSAGLSNEEADNFALTSAGVTSALEMISPNKYLFSGEGNTLAKSTVFKAIKDGVPVKQAIKEGLKTGIKEITKENIQEFSQNVGDKIIEAGHDLLTGRKDFNSSGLPSFDENLETFVLTTIATGAMAGSHIGHTTNPSNIERSAYVQAANNVDKFNQQVQSAVQEGEIQPQVGRRMMERVGEFKELNDALLEHGRDPEKASALAIEALKSKKIQERSKPLGGIKPLSHIVDESEQAQLAIGKNVSDIESDVPPVGTELTKDEVEGYLSAAGAAEKGIKLSNNGYKSQNIDLKELYKDNKEFKNYVDEAQLRPSSDKAGLNKPVVLDANGRIIDGMNRLAQQYIDGNETARGLVEMRNISVNENVRKPEVIKPQYQPSNGISITRPIQRQTITIGEEQPVPSMKENIQSPQIEDNAIPIQSTAEMDVRQQARNGEEMAEGNIQPEVITKQNQESSQENLVGNEDARSYALSQLRSAFENLSNTSQQRSGGQQLPANISQVREGEFEQALQSAIKTELGFRGIAIEPMDEATKEKIKSQVYNSIADNVPVPEEIFNDVFENLYAEETAPANTEADVINPLFDGSKSSVEIVNGILPLIKNKFIQRQIGALMPYLEANPQIKFSRMFNDAVGSAFVTGDWTVLPGNLNKKNIEGLSHAVVHELFHAISLNEIFNNEKFNNQIIDLVKKIRTQLGLETYFDDVEAHDYGNKKNMLYYGLVNQAEFIAEIFSNKEFSDLVDKTTLGEKKPILTRVIDYLKAAIGIRQGMTSDKIRQMILSSINQKIIFDNDPAIKKTVSNLQQNAQANKYEYRPQREKNWESKAARDKALTKLVDAWTEFKNKPKAHQQASILPFDVPDPIRDSKVYSALVNFFKEEIKYRINQVKGFSNKGKGVIKNDLLKTIKKEGIPVGNFEYINEAFEEAYQEAKKIPGVLSDKKDRVSIQRYIKDLIKSKISSLKEGIREGKKIGEKAGLERGSEKGVKVGIKEGQQQAKVKAKTVQKAINETLKNTGTKLSISQLKRIQSVINDAITSKNIDKTLDRAIDIATNMVYEQKNKVDIARAKKFIKEINKLKRSKSMVQQDVEWIKQLQLPSPAKVDDIKTYNEMLLDFLKSRKGNAFKTTYTKQEITDFINDENNRIHREKMASFQQDLDALIDKGELPEDVTLDDYIALLDNKAPEKLSEGIMPKQEILKREVKQRAERLPETTAYMPYNDQEKSIIDKLTQIDVNNLSQNDLIRFNNVLNNIDEFGLLDAAGDIITTDAAKKAANELAKSGNKIRQLPSNTVLSRKNISNTISSIFYNDNALSDFRSKVLSPIENKASGVYVKGQKAAEGLSDIFKKYKLGPAENARLHAFSYIYQYRGIEPGEISDNIRRKIDELVDDAKHFISEGNRIKNGKAETREGIERLNALKSLGLIDFTVIDNEGKKEVNVQVEDIFQPENIKDDFNKIKDKLSTGEYLAYDYVRRHYEDISDALEFVTRTYAGKEFVKERNYVSLVPRKKNGEAYKDLELSPDTDFTRDQRSVNRRPSGTTITRSDVKPENTYYDGDFFSNFVNRYYQSLYTAEVLPGLQTVAKTVNNDNFKKYINGQLDKGYRGKAGSNYAPFVKKLAQVVNESKNSPFFRPTAKNTVEKISKGIIASGIRLALNNVGQGAAQYAPAVLHNFAINNHKAVSFAIGSAQRAMNPTNKEFAQDRDKFLKLFTGVKRVALGSEAYQKYIKNITYQPGWWVKLTNVRESIAKVSAYSLEKGDHAAQNAAYIASYITSMIKQGKFKSAADFDFAKEAENPNAQALAYAEQQASAINNESDKSYRPDVIKDGPNAKYMWLLQGFALNAYQNAMSKAKIIADNRATSQEKSEALGHFLGYLGEIAAYQSVKHVIRGFQVALAGVLISAIWGLKTDEDDEQKKNRKQKDYIRTGANILADLTLSGVPAPIQSAVKMIANMGYKEWAKFERKSKKEEAESVGESFNPKGTYLSPFYAPYYGVEGPIGSAEFYSGAAQKAIEYMSEQIAKAQKEDDSEEEKSEIKLKTEKAARQIDIVTKAANLFLQSGDLWLMGNRMQQRLKNVKEDEEE